MDYGVSLYAIKKRIVLQAGFRYKYKFAIQPERQAIPGQKTSIINA